MAIAADTPAGEIARGRGGFYRNAADVPYVTDPSGSTVKSGARKGEPKRLAYGSPSGFGKQIENTYNLQKWGERRTVLGVGADLALIADCHALTLLDPDGDDFKAAADRIVMRAKEAAQTNLAADRGTHAHALAEDNDEGRNWIERAEAGELLGIPTEAQRALVEAWKQMLVDNDLEVLVSEASCVDDAWRLAGTLDNLARLGRDLPFVLVGGEIVTIPAGTVVVLDKKTGQRRTRPDGSIMYWHGYAVQIASYAQSKPYDTEAETRGEWPWQIDQTHALIAHLDVLGAIDGKPSCELVYVDLVAGREHGGATVVQAKAWETRRDVFSVAQLAAGGSPESSTNDSGSATLDVAAPAATIEQGVTTAVDSATGTLSPEAPLSPAQGDESATGAAGVRNHVTPAPAPAWPDQPDEGADVDPDAVAALSKRYLALPDTVRKGWFANLAHEATTGVNGYGRCPYHLGGKTGRHSVRRFEITRGLVTLAEQEHIDDDVLRAIVAAIVGDTAWWPTWLPGQVVGQLNAAEATTFAQLCDTFVGTTVPGSISPDGRLVLGFDLAAHAA